MSSRVTRSRPTPVADGASRASSGQIAVSSGTGSWHPAWKLVKPLPMGSPSQDRDAGSNPLGPPNCSPSEEYAERRCHRTRMERLHRSFALSFVVIVASPTGGLGSRPEAGEPKSHSGSTGSQAIGCKVARHAQPGRVPGRSYPKLLAVSKRLGSRPKVPQAKRSVACKPKFSIDR